MTTISIPDGRGYIKSWRSQLEHPIMSRSSHYLKLWTWILHKTNWQPQDEFGIGFITTTWTALAEALSYEEDNGRLVTHSVNVPKKIVEWLIDQDMVELISTTKGRGAKTVLRITNWEKWQDTTRSTPTQQSNNLDVEEAFSPDEELRTNDLLALWGVDDLPRTPSTLQQENALGNLHRKSPHWTVAEIEEIIAKVKAHKDGGLKWLYKRGPVMLTKCAKDGQQYAEYVKNFEPFGSGDKNNGKSTSYRVARIGRSDTAIDTVLNFTEGSSSGIVRREGGEVSGDRSSAVERI